MGTLCQFVTYLPAERELCFQTIQLLSRMLRDGNSQVRYQSAELLQVKNIFPRWNLSRHVAPWRKEDSERGESARSEVK